MFAVLPQSGASTGHILSWLLSQICLFSVELIAYCDAPKRCFFPGFKNGSPTGPPFFLHSLNRPPARISPRRSGRLVWGTGLGCNPLRCIAIHCSRLHHFGVRAKRRASTLSIKLISNSVRVDSLEGLSLTSRPIQWPECFPSSRGILHRSLGPLGGLEQEMQPEPSAVGSEGTSVLGTDHSTVPPRANVFTVGKKPVYKRLHPPRPGLRKPT